LLACNLYLLLEVVEAALIMANIKLDCWHSFRCLCSVAFCALRTIEKGEKPRQIEYLLKLFFFFFFCFSVQCRFPWSDDMHHPSLFVLSPPTHSRSKTHRIFIWKCTPYTFPHAVGKNYFYVTTFECFTLTTLTLQREESQVFEVCWDKFVWCFFKFGSTGKRGTVDV